MPWSPTREFASPLTHIPLPVASSYLNKASYGVVNNFVYSGMQHAAEGGRLACFCSYC